MSLQNSHADCVPTSAGMVAWWRGENTALDQVGPNHGTLTNGAGFVTGKVGQAFSFNGVDDYVTFPDSPNWHLGANDFTIEFWTRLSQIKKTMFIHQQSGADRGGFELDLQPAGNSAFLVFALDPNIAGISAPWLPVTNTWYHVAVTRAAGTFRLYVDGQQLGSAQFDSRPVADVTGLLRLGNYTEPLYGLAGQLDELSIYRRALTSTDIASVFAAGSGGKCGALKIAPQNGAVQLTWPTNATGYLLETNSSLSLLTGWGVLTSNYSVLNADFAVTNATSSAARFYRLHKP